MWVYGSDSEPFAVWGNFESEHKHRPFAEANVFLYTRSRFGPERQRRRDIRRMESPLGGEVVMNKTTCIQEVRVGARVNEITLSALLIARIRHLRTQMR